MDREHGFTIIEVVIASLVLTLGAMATFGLLSSATKNTQRAKATQVALNLAQQELEALRSLEDKERALTATPPHSGSPLHPNYRVETANGTFALTREPPADYGKLVVNGGSLYGGGTVSDGVINPGPVPFQSGDVSGDVYRYVVWRNDTTCGASCPGEQDFKQIVVAVKLDKPGNQTGERGYVEVQSDFIDPTDSAEGDPAPGPTGDVVTAQQFYLSDTPCAGTGAEPTERQEIAGDHQLHNTLGLCDDGMQSGTTPGAPDTLLLGAPPDPTPGDESTPLLFDYADDFYLEPTPDTDKGLQIRRDDTPGCNYEPTGTTNPESQVHRWVTDPLSVPFTLTDTATLEFFTRTLNEEVHRAKLCVYLFERQDEREVPDALLTNQNGGTAYWTYEPPGIEWWPYEGWESRRLEMTLSGAPYTIPAGARLGVALSVERQKTPADAIAIMYDHPQRPTRLEVERSTPIDGG
jgi:type II secretory pathway pseudopilin PulG